jgi:uncharacterized protein
MIRQHINLALKDAIAAGDRRRIHTLRLINAAIQDRCAAKGANGEGSLSESGVIELLQQMVEQRRRAAHDYEQSGRLELAQQELDEMEILRSFLPEELDEMQTRQECQKVVQEIGAASLKDVGRTMNTLKARYRGKMNFATASRYVREMLK